MVLLLGPPGSSNGMSMVGHSGRSSSEGNCAKVAVFILRGRTGLEDSLGLKDFLQNFDP